MSSDWLDHLIIGPVFRKISKMKEKDQLNTGSDDI